MATADVGPGLDPAQKRALLRKLLAGDDLPEDKGASAGAGNGAPGSRLDTDTASPARPHLNGVVKSAAHVGEPVDFPASYPQQRLWFLHALNPTARAYHVESTTPIPGEVDPSALARALDRIAERHAALRTTFREVDGQPRQVVSPRAHVPLARVDLTSLPAPRRQTRLEELLQAWSYEPFDLERGPLVRAALVRLAPGSHLLALYLHHIVADGWSMGIVGRELDALYREEVEGVPADLVSLPAQYVDFAVWQHEHLRGALLEDQLGYWRHTLDDLPTLELPTDRPRPSVQRHEGGHVDLLLPRSLHDALVRLGAEQGTTLFMTLLGGFAALLSRWSGSTDLPLGTYLANRRRAEWEHVVGFFLNTLVLRVRVDPEASFRTLLTEVREVALGAYDHQDTPFELVVEEMSPPRDLSRNPLFQVVFQLNNHPTQDPHTNTVDAARARRDAAVFDIGLMMFETPEGLAGQFEYSTALFDESTVRDLARRFEVILQDAVSNPDAPVGRLEVLSPGERTQLLHTTQPAARPVPLELGLLDLFAAQVAARPEAVAFLAAGRTVSFQSLDVAANRVANALRSHGVREGDHVGIVADRTLATPAAVLGTLKAGAVWVPVEPSWPVSRRDACLRVAGVGHVLAQPGLPTPPATMAVDLRAALTSGPGTAPGIRRTAEDRAYVLCTSGSTGAPKAVAATHAQILNRLHWMWRQHPWEPGDVAALKTSLGFVDSIWEIFGGLLEGVPTLVVDPRSVAASDELVGALAGARVTRLWVVPSLLRVLLDEVPDLRSRLPALDFWVSSGEDLTLELYQRFREAMPGATLYNLYGTTEIWDATWCDPATLDLARGRVPIGRPIDNVQVHVLDPNDQPVPDGWPGALHVAGAGLAEGYLGTASEESAFRDLAVAPGRVERVYATGDRVLRRPDGHLEYLGRRDGQVQVRGTRVEVAEVESALAAHEGVAACVVGTAVEEGTVELVAWWQGRGTAPGTKELLRHLRRALPASAVPSRLIRVPEIPTTTSGKVDRAALARAVRSPGADGAEHPGDGAPAPGEATDTAPAGRLEEQIAAIWSVLLGDVAVGRDDDFFADLGGHSLLGVRVLSRMRSELGVELPLRTLFEHPTVRELTEAARQLSGSASGQLSIPRVDRARHRVQDPS